jgi:hypothetical protein
MGKHFIDPKERNSVRFSHFKSKVFHCTTQIALFWPKLLPALFLKPGYPCAFEILAEAPKRMKSNFQWTYAAHFRQSYQWGW